MGLGLRSFKSATLAIVSAMEEEHGEALKEADTLSDTLSRLRFEGKASLGKNIKAARQAADFFGNVTVRHMNFEEKTIFPYLKTHIPRLEPVIHLLCEEHDDFRHMVGQFSKTLKRQPPRLDSTNAWKWMEDLTESGTYLVYLLRQHTEAERKSLYSAIQGDLRHGEKKELRSRIKNQWKKGERSNG